jgi:hypothetical protein
MYGAALAPAIVCIVGLVKQSLVATETRGIEIALGTIMIAAAYWLFGRLYLLCSVVVTESGPRLCARKLLTVSISLGKRDLSETRSPGQAIKTRFIW